MPLPFCLPSLSPVVRTGLSVAVATGLYGVSFGALGVAAGLSLMQVSALSMLMFTGGSQFAFIGVVSSGGSGGAALGAASLLGVRNLLYGIQVNALLRPKGWRRLAAAQVTIDESVAVMASQEDAASERKGFWVTGVGVFVCWNLCTVAGAVLGETVGDPRAWGLDGAAVAAFVGLLWPRLHQRDTVAIAVAAAAVTAVMIPVLPSGLPILVAAVVAVAMAAWQHRRAAL